MTYGDSACATVLPSKQQVVETWLDRQPWAGSGELETIRSYRFDDPLVAVGVEATLVRVYEAVGDTVASGGSRVRWRASRNIAATLSKRLEGFELWWPRGPAARPWWRSADSEIEAAPVRRRPACARSAARGLSGEHPVAADAEHRNNPRDEEGGRLSDTSWMVYAWRCDDCGEQHSVDSSDEAEASARDHRTVTHHVTLVTIGPEGETPVSGPGGGEGRAAPR